MSRKILYANGQLDLIAPPRGTIILIMSGIVSHWTHFLFVWFCVPLEAFPIMSKGYLSLETLPLSGFVSH